MAQPVEMPFGWVTGWPKEPCIRWGSRSQKGKGQFLRLSVQSKNIVSHCWGVCSRKQ